MKRVHATIKINNQKWSSSPKGMSCFIIISVVGMSRKFDKKNLSVKIKMIYREIMELIREINSHYRTMVNNYPYTAHT